MRSRRTKLRCMPTPIRNPASPASVCYQHRSRRAFPEARRLSSASQAAAGPLSSVASPLNVGVPQSDDVVAKPLGAGAGNSSVGAVVSERWVSDASGFVVDCLGRLLLARNLLTWARPSGRRHIYPIHDPPVVEASRAPALPLRGPPLTHRCVAVG
eukprot:2382172-Prymnesium_polylepis.1